MRFHVVCLEMSWQLTALGSVVASRTSSEHVLVMVLLSCTPCRTTNSLADSFATSYSQLYTGRTLFMIDCRPFRDLDNDKILRRHVGFHKRILRTVLDADGRGRIHRDLQGKVDCIMKSRNIFIMICKSGRQRSVSDAGLWSRTLTRFGRESHKASTLSLCQQDKR